MALLQLQKIKTSPLYKTPQFWTLLAQKRAERDICEHYTASILLIDKYSVFM